ncbi:MAG: hypothetical protein J6S49_01660 [Erysipelotrichaceae bacterium]|nr:hypothetical protein [Erysipelotrichaceae bacterium]
MDYKNLFSIIEQIHKESGISRIKLLYDIIYCGMKFGAGFNDYKLYRFYELTDEQRSTYVNRTNNNQIVRALNDPEYYHIVDDKIEFNEHFAAYMKRDWLDMRKTSLQEFEKFCEKHDEMMIKPLNLTGGAGVEKLYVKDYSSIKELYDLILSKKAYLVEEVVKQHHDISKIYPYSVNTYRVLTIKTDDDVDVIYGIIRFGNNGSVVDNHHAGGMSTPFDVETGKILYPAVDLDLNLFEEHPMTHVKFVGYQLPFWPEAKQMVKEAALLIPEIRYNGWDVAVSEDGPLLIEGNYLPGYDLMQLPGQNPEKIGMLPVYRKYVKGI